jgi:hypothetical protein
MLTSMVSTEWSALSLEKSRNSRALRVALGRVHHHNSYHHEISNMVMFDRSDMITDPVPEHGKIKTFLAMKFTAQHVLY